MKQHFIAKFKTDFSKVDKDISILNRNGSYDTITYEKLWEDTLYYATELEQIGVGEGKLVLFVMDTSFDYLKAFLSSQVLNATTVSIYPPTSIEDKLTWLEKSADLVSILEVDYVITTPEIRQPLEKDAYFKGRVFVEAELLKYRNSLFKYDEGKLSEQAISFVQFSSGTTGKSKAIAISQQALVNNIEAILDGVGLDVSRNVNCVSWLPLYHDMGLVGGLAASLAAKGKLTLITPENFVRKPYLWLKAISDQKANVTVAPNFAFGLVSKRIKEKQLEYLDLSTLKVALCGAEMVLPSTLNSFISMFKSFGLDQNCIMPVYGMAEGTLAVSFSKPGGGHEVLTFDKDELAKGKAVESRDGIKLCSVGTAVKGVELVVRNNKGEDLAEGEVGEINFFSDALFSGFYGTQGIEEAIYTKEDPYPTGDRGFLYKGKLYVCGRIKEMIIVRGRNYLPAFFESKIMELEGIRKGKVVVFSYSLDGAETEQIVVLAEKRDSLNNQSREKIYQSINRIFADQGLTVRETLFLDSGALPRTTSGKLKRFEAKRMYLSSEFGERSLFQKIRQRILRLFLK